MRFFRVVAMSALVGLLFAGATMPILLAGTLTASTAHAAESPSAESALNPLVNPASMAPKHPSSCSISAGSYCCVQLTLKGQRTRVTTSVAASFEVGLGNSTTPTASAASNDIGALSPEIVTLTPQQDTICAFSASSGTLKVATTYP
jgi:hypothetical protein